MSCYHFHFRMRKRWEVANLHGWSEARISTRNWLRAGLDFLFVQILGNFLCISQVHKMMTVPFLFPSKSLFMKSMLFHPLQGVIYSIFINAHCWMSRGKLSPPLSSKNTAIFAHGDYKVHPPQQAVWPQPHSLEVAMRMGTMHSFCPQKPHAWPLFLCHRSSSYSDKKRNSQISDMQS